MQYRCITTRDNDTSRAYNSARQVDTYVGMHVTPTFFLRQTHEHWPVRYSQSFANDVPLPLKLRLFDFDERSIYNAIRLFLSRWT